MRQVYLDNHASTPVLPEVFEAMRPYFSEHFASASSFHQAGLRVREGMAKAREQVAALIHAESPVEIIFTSSGTEAVNLAIKGVAYASQARGNHIITSAIEHPSVLNSIEFLKGQGFICTEVGVNKEGFVNPEEVRAALTDNTVLIALHHANHDIGTIQAIQEIGRIAGEAAVPLFVDANASGGWLPIDVQAMGASLLSLSPHRFYGPKGVGVLYRNRRARVASLIHGGVQEGGRRAGTENVPAIVGAGVAAELAQRDLEKRMAHTGELQRKLWEGLKGRIAHLKLNGPEPLIRPSGTFSPSDGEKGKRITTNLNISFEFIEGEGLMLLADTRGIAFTSGTACVSQALKASPVLAAIGLPNSLALGAVILSLGKDNSGDDIDYVLDIFPKLIDRLRDMSPSWEDFQKGLTKSVL